MLNRILIEPQTFAEQGQTLSGQTTLHDLDKRVWSPDITDLSAEIHFTLQGGKDRWQRLFLQLHLQGQLLLQCQRCMQDVDFQLNEEVRIVLFDNENALDDAMCADEELEGMVCEPECDVFTLLEDQILMALPFSPKHENCEPNHAFTNQNKTNPFTVLAGLKKTD